MQNKQQTKKRERSVAYPSFSLNEAIESSVQLRTTLGKGPYSRNEAAIALGYKGVSGISATKISTMVHFGLLNRNGNTYSQSELAERINHPLSDEDRNSAINEAVQMPKLYKDLLTRFAGEALPTQLGNILIRNGISAKISDSVAENFKNSLEFSGSLKNGVVLAIPNFPTKKEEQGNDKSDEVLPFSSVSALAGTNTKQINSYHDSGDGWMLAVQSIRPLTSDIKKKLVDIAEFLENGSTKNN